MILHLMNQIYKLIVIFQFCDLTMKDQKWKKKEKRNNKETTMNSVKNLLKIGEGHLKLNTDNYFQYSKSY